MLSHTHDHDHDHDENTLKKEGGLSNIGLIFSLVIFYFL